ncbi:MAG: AMP-binding protein [Tannerellaceae bacterium]|jgi:long-chain acyl-CoA synthetase|nr:AMP-binding protein [Tannerellaceae bacterium]
MKKTIIDLFEQSADKYSANTFLLEKKNGSFIPTCYEDVRKDVYRLGAGLMALGVARGDNMALLSEGRNDWIVGELAMFYAGAVNVPLSIKLEETNDLLFRLTHAEVSFVMVSGRQLKKIRAITGRLPLVRRVIVMDEPEDGLAGGEILMDEVRRMGDAFLRAHSPEDFLAVGRSLSNDDYATITYTSGTTADPKGVILTHRNYTANVEQALSCMDIDQSWRTLIILPLDHCFAHVVGFYIFMSKGAAVATVQVGRSGMETLRNIPVNIKEIRPSLILSVPALAKNFRKNILQGVHSKGRVTEALFNLGLRTAEACCGDSSEEEGRGWRMLLRPLHWLLDRVVMSKVRQQFGGELKFFVGGGALLDKDLQKFFYSIGIPMYQGYGLSEATPVISSNGTRRHRFGSSGVPVRPLELRICDSEGRTLPEGEKGEIVVKGENVMAGYWKNPVSTAETLRDGWLYTGDMGYMHDGLLYVLGRFKSLLISSDGEKYSPEGIEEALMEQSSAISQLLLYNNQSPYTVALLVPNREDLSAALSRKSLSLETEEGRREAINIISRQIDRFRAKGDLSGLFPDRWLPSTFAVMPEAWTEQNGMVNSTMKVVRGKVEQAAADRLRLLFTPEGKDPLNEMNLQALE